MRNRFTVEKIDKTNSDFVFMAMLILLVGIGFVAMFSSSYYYAEKLTGDPQFFLKKHIKHLVAGGILAFIVSRVSLSLIHKAVPVLILVSFVMIGMTFIPGISSQVLGARRWIIIFGTSFQPSEFAKFAIIVYLAHIFSKKGDRIDDIVNTMLPPFVIVGSMVVLVYLQNDFSTAVFIVFITLTMFFIAGTRLIYFIFLGSAVIPLSVILLLTKEHRVQRIISFLNPQLDPVGVGYQVIASRAALMRGGLWGSGLGKGTKKLGGLPEAHSDFVFAVVGEEIGFIGIFFILGLFIAFAARGYMIAFGCKDKFTYYLAFGITTSLISQALFNIAVVSGLVPATGIPLPFFSTGGSSIIVSLIMCGLILNISRQPGAEAES